MCGIWLFYDQTSETTLDYHYQAFHKIMHRGPDTWRLEADAKVNSLVVGFHRLAIIDRLNGMQPMRLQRYPHLTLIANGEIYNYKELFADGKFNQETYCDVEVILHLFAQGGITHCIKQLDGEFAFCLIDAEKNRLYIVRDPFGVRPLFTLQSNSGFLGVCSEAKGLTPLLNSIPDNNWVLQPFAPGYYESYDLSQTGRAKLIARKEFYSIGVSQPEFTSIVPESILAQNTIAENIRQLLTVAVKKRMMSERKIGCLLSGGLDSSLIAALLVKLGQETHLCYPLQTFSIGMGCSPDIIAARQVAEYLGTEHHEIIFDEMDVANVLDDVIYSVETADITTIRASVAMYLLARYIKNHTEATVIFSGEGSDELAQGYIYFRDAPDASAAHHESIRLLRNIYLYDGLRADRTTAAHGLELRLPFLDQQFTAYYLSLSPKSRQPNQGIEKYLLRSAFDGQALLPEEILWRHKEALSDGVASIKKSLFQVIQEHIQSKVTVDQLQTAVQNFSHCPPKTKEALYYRYQLEKNFPNLAPQLMPAYWMPRWVQVDDPSARFITHYTTDYKKQVATVA